MGFILTLLYLGTTYLSAETVFGPLAALHVEVIIAVLVILFSLPTIPRSIVLKTPQSLALIGLAIAVFISLAMTGWFGGAVGAFLRFIPSAFAYYLICLHCNTTKRLKVLILLLMFVCFFVITRGIIDLHNIDLRGLPDIPGAVAPYLDGQRNDSGQWIFRIKGQNLINDPNDFSQLIVCLIPLIFIFWRRKKIIRNVLLVLLPVSILLYGAFLTHSRGFLLAFIAVLVMAGRRRVGTIPSLVVAGLLFFGATVLNFTGGRDVSVEAGSGRIALWGGGLGLLKTHPIFGVGYGMLPDYLGLTAHNSIVACVAELGFFGFFFWCLFLFPTLSDAFAAASPAKLSEGEPPPKEEGLYPRPALAKDDLDKAEANRLGELMVLSLTGFLVAGFFLSRGLVLTFFLLGGVTEVIFEMALKRGMIHSRLKFGRILKWTGILTLALPTLVEIIIRVAILT